MLQLIPEHACTRRKGSPVSNLRNMASYTKTGKFADCEDSTWMSKIFIINAFDRQAWNGTKPLSECSTTLQVFNELRWQVTSMLVLKSTVVSFIFYTTKTVSFFLPLLTIELLLCNMTSHTSKIKNCDVTQDLVRTYAILISTYSRSKKQRDAFTMLWLLNCI